MTNGTQRYRGISGRNNRLAAKWTLRGSVRDHVVEMEVAKLVRHVAQCAEGDKCVGVLEANGTLWKAEKELNGRLEGGTLVPHKGTEKAFTF